VSSIFKPQTKRSEISVFRPFPPITVPGVKLVFKDHVAEIPDVRFQFIVILTIREQVDRGIAHVFQSERQACRIGVAKPIEERLFGNDKDRGPVQRWEH